MNLDDIGSCEVEGILDDAKVGRKRNAVEVVDQELGRVLALNMYHYLYAVPISSWFIE